MVNAQECIINTYPDKSIKELKLSNKNLEGDLDLSEYTHLESIDFSINKINSIKLPASIKNLRCSRNKLTNLDVSGLSELEVLRCDSNQLVNLDVTKNKNLSQLVCSHNKIRSLVVKENKKLTNLNVFHNQLTDLDVSLLVELERINATKNNLTTLTVTPLEKLININISGNKITDLDVSKCLSLEYLNLPNNKVSTIDTSNLEKLIAIDFSGNPISSINCTNLRSLETIDFSSSSITNIDFLDELPNPKKITSINISNNSGLSNDCYSNGFDKFFNLQGLDLSQNNFSGSLETLRYLRWLEFLNISDTNIESGLEFLPVSIPSSGFLFFSSEERFKVKKIEQELEPFSGELEKWQESQSTFVQRMEETISNLQSQINSQVYTSASKEQIEQSLAEVQVQLTRQKESCVREKLTVQTQREKEIVERFIRELDLATQKEQEQALDLIISEIKQKITPPTNDNEEALKNKLREKEEQIQELKKGNQTQLDLEKLVVQREKENTELNQIKSELESQLNANQKALVQNLIQKSNQVQEEVLKEEMIKEVEKILDKNGIDSESFRKELMANTSLLGVGKSSAEFSSKKINQLDTRLKSAVRLNIGLGVLSLGSLLILTYVLVKKSGGVKKVTHR
jgi:Leucine-rich repeat (LRR) protein